MVDSFHNRKKSGGNRPRKDWKKPSGPPGGGHELRRIAMPAPAPGKPKLELQTTTLWEYPSQHYGEGMQGDAGYVGATPSWVIWNLLERYTRPGDLVVDPMCGSGTTLDVARDLDRRALGYDVAPTRPDIFRVDARKLPPELSAKADFVFVDPPYSTHVDYSDSPNCIGKLDALDESYYDAMALAIAEMDRVLKPGRYMALYVSDSWRNKKPFCPIGFRLFGRLCRHFEPIDIIAVVRHNKTLKRNHYHTEAVKGNYFLRGFNYLFILRKAGPERKARFDPAAPAFQPEPPATPQRPPHAHRSGPQKGPHKTRRPTKHQGRPQPPRPRETPDDAPYEDHKD